MKKVLENQDLARDDYSGAVLNTNISAYEAAKAARERMKQEQMRLDSVADDVNQLKRQMSDIHDLLTQLIERK